MMLDLRILMIFRA